MRVLILGSNPFTDRIVNAIKSENPNNKVAVTEDYKTKARGYKPDLTFKVPGAKISSETLSTLYPLLLSEFCVKNEIDFVFPQTQSPLLEALYLANESLRLPGLGPREIERLKRCSSHKTSSRNTFSVIVSVSNYIPFIHAIIDFQTWKKTKIRYDYPSKFCNENFKIQERTNRIIAQNKIKSGILLIDFVSTNNELNVLGVHNVIPGAVIELMSRSYDFPEQFVRMILNHVVYDKEPIFLPSRDACVSWIPLLPGKLNHIKYPKLKKSVYLINPPKPGSIISEVQRDIDIDQRGWVSIQYKDDEDKDKLYLDFINEFEYPIIR